MPTEDQTPNPDSEQTPGEAPQDNAPNELLIRYDTELKLFDRQWIKRFKQIGENRQWVRGFMPDQDAEDGEPLRQKAPLIAANHRAMAPNLYAKNPDISVRPRPQVGGQGYTVARQFGETLEHVVSYDMRRGGLKRAVNKVLRSNEAAGLGWLKVSYQRDFKEQPHIRNKIKDAQDNLRRLVGLQQDIAEATDDTKVEMEQLVALITSLDEQVEVLVAEGVVFEFVAVENIRLHPSLNDLEEYLRSPYICQDIYMPLFQYRNDYGLTKKEAASATLHKYNDEKDEYEALTNRDESDTEEYSDVVCVRELWDSRTNTVYTWSKGSKTWCKDPWVPDAVGERWYPFFCLALLWTDGYAWPKAPTEEMIPIQVDHDRILEQESAHREMNKPAIIYPKDKIELGDVISVTKMKDREFVGVNSANLGNAPFSQAFQAWQGIPMQPALYDTQKSITMMQWISGVQDAARGAVTVNKTLGEAEIANAHMSARVGAMQDTVEDFMTDVATYTAQLELLNRDPQKVAEISGDEAYWPTEMMDRQTIYELLEVEIRAGSMGKPDKMKERQQFAELSPVWMEVVGQVMMLRAQGIPDELNPYHKFAEWMLSVYDERRDIDELLPNPMQQQPPMMGGVGPDGMPMGPDQMGAMPPEMGANVVPFQGAAA